MGGACGNNRRPRLGFFQGLIQSVSLEKGQIQILCTDSSVLITRSVTREVCELFLPGDRVTCFLDQESTLITPALAATEPVVGKVTRPRPSYCLFQTDDGAQCILPPFALLSSFEISAKAVDCILTANAEGYCLRVSRYNPFSHFTIDDVSEKRHLARFRSSLSDYEENKVNVSQLKRLNEKYAAFRRVIKDGNSLYRCIFILYLEHLCRKTTPLSELETFLSNVDSKLSYYAMLPDYVVYSDRVSSVLHKLRSLKSAGRFEELPTLQWILQDTSVDMALIHYLRLLVANFTALHYRSSRLKRFINTEIKELVGHILAYGQEAESIVKYIIPDLLGVVLIQQDVSIDCDDVFEAYYTPVKAGKYPVLHFCKSTNYAYHLLYSTAQQDIDGYCFATNTYDLTDLTEEKVKMSAMLYHEILASDLNAIQT